MHPVQKEKVLQIRNGLILSLAGNIPVVGGLAGLWWVSVHKSGGTGY